ncbi:DeoR/GlpR family transcriptional regulator [Maribrevibacterium harenarium]|uniref:DeoR/GlpR family transcriptional regulator n=1 Tax=Maribrevibacterium harenarium TaxID=2589817 RepID=A0A501WFF8_9GAMM|nr:DeoR/GlpR family transcriptional regulator [Maribrevibacterium harenarium]TPE47090.1 DeoR/GlpR family transcriptional regulator [Maribrevibacterium harenarium]
MGQQTRQERIIQLVREQGYASIDQLASQFNVTPQTIRRDINTLADQNLLRRHHGGASIDSSTTNVDYSTRQALQLDAKRSIAHKVAAEIPNGASLFINIGTTTEEIARALLQHEGLKIITNNINVASILRVKEDFNVIVAGGTVRSRDGGIIGEATLDFINQFRVDYGIIGISAIDPEDGSLLDFDYQEVRVAQGIIANSRHVFLAADNAKFGRSAMVRLGNITQVERLFTDAPPPKSIQALLKEHGVRLELCPQA